MRCAVVGVGMIGAAHVKVVADLPTTELVACCDVDGAVRKHVPAGVPFFEDAATLLDAAEFDAVLVCTPQDTHRRLVEMFLAAGVHVFCEKPIAATPADADALAALGRASGRLVVGHMLRFDPNYLAVAEAVAAGDVGAAVTIAARRAVPDFEGRVIAGRTTIPLELAVHDIDVLRWLGGDIARVFAFAAQTATLGAGLTDAVCATVAFASGAVGVLDFNWIMPAATGHASDYRLAVFGTGGSAYVELRSPPVAVLGGVTRFPRSDGLADVPGGLAGVLRTEVEHFARVVRGLGEWPCTVEDAAAAVRVAAALDEAIESGVPVAV